MSNEYCDICLNNGRPVKFVSGRIHICQWCVTLLQDTPIDPQKIEEHLMGIIKKHARKPPEAPDKNEIRRTAHSYVTAQESFFEAMITSLFNKDKRERNIQELFNKMSQTANASYKAELINPLVA